MVAVRFLHSWTLYNGGEVAGFDPETAAFLVKNGVAVLADEAAPAKPTKRAKKADAAVAAEPKGKGDVGADKPAAEAG